MTGPGGPDASAGRLLNAAWAALGGPADALDRLDVRGDATGLLPSAVPALPAMLAAVATSTLAVSLVHAARTGSPPPPVTLDAGHVAVAARSERHAAVPRMQSPPSFAPLSRFWATRDGYVRMHANYPWHRDRALRVLGCTGDPDSVAAALRERDTVDVEESFASAGALAFGVRSLQEWRAHPQGRAVASLPLVELADIEVEAAEGAGRAGAGARLGERRLLDGVRVLDLTRVIAGPVATRTLAAWGADVLRVDSPALPENEDQCIDTLTGKRSILLDAAGSGDRAVLEELLAHADVVVQGYRPGALARLGLGATDLGRRHPHLTVATISAWGRTGPWAGRRGFDSLVQAPTGLSVLEGRGRDEPGVLPAQVLDHATGYLAAAAAALSLASVATGGPPRHAWLSLAQTSAWLTAALPDNATDPATAPITGPGRPGPAPDPARWMVHVPGPGPGVDVVAPPGRIGPFRPGWQATTRFGGDAPSFAGGRAGTRPDRAAHP